MSQILENFKNPPAESKGMFRCWFPDAGADLDRIENHVRTVYNAGFGGMEIAMVPQFTEFDQREYGWATPRWKEMLRRILRTADALPEPFRIDLTITAHWPPALNTIDPNHPAAQKELSHTITKITRSGVMDLPMPKTRTCDDDNPDAAHFIFTDQFLCAVAGRIVGRKGEKYILAADSLRDVSAFVKETEKTTPAGIALDETLFGDKPKLANVQHYWTIDLDAAGIAPSAEGDWAEGDTLLFAYYTRGTGQTLSGRTMTAFHLFLPMADKMYATDYYCTEGTDAIIDVWETKILDDPEIRALMNRIGGAIFEDSIELACSTIPWTNRFAENFKAYRGYDILPYLPILQSLKGSEQRFLVDTRIEKLLVDDYYTTLNDLYLRDHVGRITEWTHTFGCQYRAQSYGGDVNTSAASCVLDIAEGESLGFGGMREYFRNISGGVHMSGRKFVSDEILADLGKGYQLDWKSAAATFNSNWAAGVNRGIIHGMSYESEISGKYSQWPGWHAFQAMFADPWGDRQTYWSNVGNFAGYLARTQAVLQGGRPRMDLAVYKGQRAYGWGYTRLLDHGYSYDIISNPHLQLPRAVVKDGMLCPDGPCYRALLVADQEMIPAVSAEKLLALAEQGLTILFVGGLPARSNGAFTPDSAAVDIVEKMLALPNVSHVDDLDAAAAALEQAGIRPLAAYRDQHFEPICREEGEDRWYFLYNHGEAASADVTLSGKGVPVRMDAWTGAMMPMPYVSADGGVTVSLSLAEDDAAIIALLPEEEAPAEAQMLRPIAVTACGLKIESWGPDPEAAVPTASKKTVVDFGQQTLGTWTEIKADAAQLETIGVDAMDHVSGRGVYAAEVELPACDGAILTCTTGDCMVVEGRLNGALIGALNQRSGSVDLGSLVREGTNALELTVATTLISRMRIEHPLFSGASDMPAPAAAPGAPGEDGAPPLMGNLTDEDYELPAAPMDMPGLSSKETAYGLLSITITPYILKK